MDLRFGDHPSFHRAALGMVGASAALALALHPITPMAPLVAGIFGIAVGAALGYGRAAWRIIAAMAAALPIVAMTPSWPALAAGAGVLGLGLAVGGPRGMRGLMVVMIGAIVALLAMWAALRFGHAQKLATWPAWANDLASGSAMGIVGVLAALPRHLSFESNPVAAAMRGLPRDLDGEVRDLCTRAVAIWNGAKGSDLVRDGVLKTLEVAAKTTSMPKQSDDDLAKRMEDLDARIAAASDDEVKAQYRSARAALDDQRRYRDQIRQNRERVIARLHNHVAALEKFQLAASGLEAARAATAGATAVKQLDELSQEVAASGEALAELELGVPAKA